MSESNSIDFPNLLNLDVRVIFENTNFQVQHIDSATTVSPFFMHSSLCEPVNLKMHANHGDTY